MYMCDDCVDLHSKCFARAALLPESYGFFMQQKILRRRKLIQVTFAARSNVLFCVFLRLIICISAVECYLPLRITLMSQENEQQGSSPIGFGLLQRKYQMGREQV
jgi:hypothetical protein